MTALNQQQLFLSGFRTGPGFIGWLSPDGVFKQLAFATDQEAIDLIGNHSGNANVWVSMATFGPGARREAHSALHLKSFWLDVDAHGKGPYGTPDEALAGINSFVADAGLPQPNYIHMTGHGTQVFWVLARSALLSPKGPVRLMTPRIFCASSSQGGPSLRSMYRAQLGRRASAWHR